MASLRMGNGNGKKSNIHTDDLDWGEAFQVRDVAPQKRKTLLISA